ncbi:hypothetical protein L1987_66967 [Smallanthus sonchifolius]|uniref:Uncharacterized protein n=1 Tax=Smallanthus sonchifolius TaxID=185202 RepID=A0ACB9BYL4_9ASTR|nr:hypothetical protein L1987_66967 [Smallanthus sonchifolius]
MGWDLYDILDPLNWSKLEDMRWFDSSLASILTILLIIVESLKIQVWKIFHKVGNSAIKIQIGPSLG